jgi:hypothetical protein
MAAWVSGDRDGAQTLTPSLSRWERGQWGNPVPLWMGSLPSVRAVFTLIPGALLDLPSLLFPRLSAGMLRPTCPALGSAAVSTRGRSCGC